MQQVYDYFIVGAGMAGDAAAAAIRKADADAGIGMLGAEPHRPYNRPPLSKDLWKGKDEEEVLWRSSDHHGADVKTGRRAVSLDTANKTVSDDQDCTYEYGKLLLATGGRPRRLPFDSPRVVHFRTLDDYRFLARIAADKLRVAVVGGGFIGSEIAAALVSRNCKVTLVFPEDGIGARGFPAGLSAYLTQYYRDKGVDVRPGVKVAGGEADDRFVRLELSDGDTLDADVAVAGLGIQPDTELAEQAGLEVDDGIVVDERLRSSAEDVHAAGDVASFVNPALGRMRVEHEDNALSMGGHAGRSMAGASDAYTHLPMFYSDLFDLGYEAVGQVDSRLQTVEDWSKPNEEGVVYYLDEGRVRGVLLWNVWDQVEHARELINESGPHDAQSLKGRLPR